MRIYKRSEFLKLPAGTVYQKVEPWAVVGFLYMKIKDCGDNDWFCVELTGIDTLPKGVHKDMLNGTSSPWNLSMSRDGCFDGEETLFLVHEPDDLRKMADVLLKSADGGLHFSLNIIP